jgi:hypothetical protein
MKTTFGFTPESRTAFLKARYQYAEPVHGCITHHAGRRSTRVMYVGSMRDPSVESPMNTYRGAMRLSCSRGPGSKGRRVRPLRATGYSLAARPL